MEWQRKKGKQMEGNTEIRFDYPLYRLSSMLNWQKVQKNFLKISGDRFILVMVSWGFQLLSEQHLLYSPLLFAKREDCELLSMYVGFFQMLLCCSGKHLKTAWNRDILAISEQALSGQLRTKLLSLQNSRCLTPFFTYCRKRKVKENPFFLQTTDLRLAQSNHSF